MDESARIALDSAIARVAKKEYRRLTEGKSLMEQKRLVDEALGDLLKLSQGSPPDYDSEWVALFYLTWYQPRQVWLAYSVFRNFILFKRKPPQQVVDFGCGASAVRIALAILTIELGSQQVPMVHGIDSSTPMRRIGEPLWREFVGEMISLSVFESRERVFRRILDFMTSSCSVEASYDAFAKPRSTKKVAKRGDCWLTAVHAIYQSNREDVKAVFDDIRKDHEPTLELVTFNGQVDGDPQSFFGKLGFVVEGNMESSRPGVLEQTTEWRKELLNTLGELRHGRLLNSDVRWMDSRINNVVMKRSAK